MKVYIIFSSDMECGGYYRRKVFDSEEKAKAYIEPLNKEIYDQWLEFAEEKDDEYIKMKLEEYGSAEAYAEHMYETENYYYVEAEIE